MFLINIPSILISVPNPAGNPAGNFIVLPISGFDGPLDRDMLLACFDNLESFNDWTVYMGPFQ